MVINIKTVGFYLAIVSLVILMATRVYAEVPETTYTDKIIGKDEVADLTRIESVRHVIEVTKQPTIENPVIELKVTQVVRAGIAEVDIVERTTRRGVEGAQTPVHGVIYAIGALNPVLWAIGQNPIKMAQYTINTQVTNYKLIYQSKPRPLMDERRKEFTLPAKHLVVQIIAEDLLRNFVFPYEANEDGNVTVRLQPLVALLTQAEIGLSPERALTLLAGTTLRTERDLAKVEVPRNVLSHILHKLKEADQTTNQ